MSLRPGCLFTTFPPAHHTSDIVCKGKQILPELLNPSINPNTVQPSYLTICTRGYWQILSHVSVYITTSLKERKHRSPLPVDGEQNCLTVMRVSFTSLYRV